jgi:hypothetical protein
MDEARVQEAAADVQNGSLGVNVCEAIGVTIELLEVLQREFGALSWWKRARLALALPVLRLIEPILCDRGES